MTCMFAKIYVIKLASLPTFLKSALQTGFNSVDADLAWPVGKTWLTSQGE